jgi:hypothetical protein
MHILMDMKMRYKFVKNDEKKNAVFNSRDYLKENEHIL